ncbi:MAG TPA: Ig-like domain-containing protein [Candidatus Limnocylindria bacterium]
MTANPSVTQHLRSRQALARVGIATLVLGIAFASSLSGASAKPTPAPVRPMSLLPQNVGVGIRTVEPVTIAFPEPMDTASVVADLVLLPRTQVSVGWSADGRTAKIYPVDRWRTDARYTLTVPASARLASGKAAGQPVQVSFTTETAPVISDFQVHYVGQTDEDRIHAVQAPATDGAAATTLTTPADTTADVSARTTITIGFSKPMDQADVEKHFLVTPAVDGAIAWEGNALVFTPSERLKPNARYGISLVGAHDSQGNRLGGDLAFSFTTRPGAQLVKVSPAKGARDVTDTTVALWFSQPMDRDATTAALKVTDATTKAALAGKPSWNANGTQLSFVLDAALTLGHAFTVELGDGARDVDGNAITASWSYSSKAAPRPRAAVSRPTTRAVSGPPAPADALAYALWQINQDRAAYGLGPLVLDSAISGVASGHAWDQMTYGYFSHTGRDGSRVSDRLRAAGISFSWSGENMCYLSGQGLTATLNWCNSTFMAEPYPGYANHIGNILSTHFTRVGVGIAQSGAKIIVVWDFAG